MQVKELQLMVYLVTARQTTPTITPELSLVLKPIILSEKPNRLPQRLHNVLQQQMKDVYPRNRTKE